MELKYAGAMLPMSGQDACFLQGCWMGVADGVGGWAELGIDSGNFSRELIENSRALALCNEGARPKDVLVEAVGKCKALGSSTILLARLDGKESVLHAANLGDSGFLVIRDWEVVASSRSMQVNFSTPCQVGYHPDPEIEVDDPHSAETYKIQVAEGDLLVMATDGLTDFLFKDKIMHVLRKCVEQEEGTVEECAVRLARKTRDRMSRSTPYFDACESNVKIDDITILLARIVKDGDGDQRGRIQMLKQPGHELESSEGLKSSDESRKGEGQRHRYRLHFAAKTVPVAEGHCHDSYFAEQCWLGVATEPCSNFPANLQSLCGRFSQRLLASCKPFIAEGQMMKPKAVMVNAARKTKEKVPKTSTLLVAGLLMDEELEALLHVANVGDSRLLIIRNWQVVASTTAMRHPCCAENENGHPFDQPVVIYDPRKVAQVYEFRIQQGDIIVCGSSGLFDNLYENTIVNMVKKCGGNAELAAEKLAGRAMDAATPRIRALVENTGPHRVQKVGDVTAIVAVVGPMAAL